MLASKFLSAPWPTHEFRSVEISLLMTASLTDFYLLLPGMGNAAIASAGTSSTPVNARNNVWETIGRALVAMPNLRRLRVWVDSKDLRPWHKAAAETRIFARLAEVRQPADFVLSLPSLPEDEAARDLAGCYLEGEELEGKPFRVERGERPDKWKVYLSSRAGILPARLAQEVPIIHMHDL